MPEGDVPFYEILRRAQTLSKVLNIPFNFMFFY